VRRGHFDALRPVCSVCRAAPLEVTAAVREAGDDLIEGILTCTSGACRREYPVVDGIPVLVAAIRGWLAANPLQMLLRDDLSPEMEGLVGDALGPQSPFDTLRQQISIYAADHYGSGSALALQGRALDLAGDPPRGPVLDIGCATGGTTFALAERLGRPTLGIDLNFAMLRVASRALREGTVRYARRRVGVVYDRVETAVEVPSPEGVDFWCCDAGALPFADTTFALASSLNVVDCVAAPCDALAALARVLAPDGKALIATPYDWTPQATAVGQWLGGHSQRGAHRGCSEPVLRSALEELGLEVIAEEAEWPWRLRVHERSAVDYQVHLVVARRPLS
jgi:SAM-dependent methyltransferase/uncharacterized protein YbaR (Trm112 family)